MFVFIKTIKLNLSDLSMSKKEFNSIKYSTSIDENNLDLETKIRIKIVLEFIGKNKRVLDIGCYDGYITEKIKNQNNEVVGIDISKEGVRLCVERGINCIEYDIEKSFPFNDKSFDVVFGGEIIEHIFDTDAMIQEIRRVLKPNGFLILTTPNIAALTKRIRLLFGKNPFIEIGLISDDGMSAGHIRYFTINSLKKLLNRNDFIIDIWKTDFVTLHKMRLVWLGKIFPRLGYSLIVKAVPSAHQYSLTKRLDFPSNRCHESL